jgi:hypothetical protein
VTGGPSQADEGKAQAAIAWLIDTSARLIAHGAALVRAAGGIRP